MRTLEVATEQLQWLKEDSPSRARAQRKRVRRCSDFVPPCPTQKVLFVGAERWDEFKDAMRLVCQGHDVMAINPRETAAARAFRPEWTAPSRGHSTARPGPDACRQ